MAHDGVPRRACSLCGQRDRLLRRVGWAAVGDPDYAVALCLRCDGPASQVRPHPRDHPAPRRRSS